MLEENLDNLLGDLTEVKKKVQKESKIVPRVSVNAAPKAPSTKDENNFVQKSAQVIELTEAQINKASLSPKSSVKVVEQNRKWGQCIVLERSTSIYGYADTVQGAIENCLENIVAWRKEHGTK